MATFGPPLLPPLPDDAGAAQGAYPAFAAARWLILQHALATVTHALGNLTSPVSLVADALAASPTSTQQASAAGTLRTIAGSLRHATAMCRMLRGTGASGTLAPAAFTDTTHWWTLMQPFVADMLPDTTRLDGRVAAVPLAAAQYEPLVWTTLACALFARTTRPASADLTVTGEADAHDGRTLIVQFASTAPRSMPAPRIARELKQLAVWEATRAGGSVRMTSSASRLVTRISIPPSPDRV